MELCLRMGYKTNSTYSEPKATARVQISGDKEVVELIKAHLETLKPDPKPEPGWDTIKQVWFIE